MSPPIQIPSSNPKANYLAHKGEIDAAIARVLESGWYILGREVQSFEQEFAAYIGVHDAIGVANGTDALKLSLQACGVGVGDLVFTVSHTAVATVAAIELAGATPVLVDIDPVTYTMDPNCLEDALAHPWDGTPKAVIPVHLYGHPADMVSILELANRHALYVIEDCAQSHGATLDGRMTGAWGDIASFSFYPTKNLGALGDGGMIVTDNPALAERTRLLQQYGWRERYISDIPGGNSRLDELQAAILRVKLRFLDADNEKRRSIAALYTDHLVKAGFSCPVLSKKSRHIFHQYVICSSRRDNLKTYLNERGIGTNVHYPQAVHEQPAYAGRIPVSAPLTYTEKAVREILSLPMYPELTLEQAKFVVDALLAWKKSL